MSEWKIINNESELLNNKGSTSKTWEMWLSPKTKQNILGLHYSNMKEKSLQKYP